MKSVIRVGSKVDIRLAVGVALLASVALVSGCAKRFG